MYTYYTPVQESEHMPYASEIADAYGICVNSTTDNPHTRLIREIIEDYMTKNSIVSKPLFFSSSHLARVYPRDIFVPAITQFLAKVRRGKGEYKALSGRIYQYKIKNKII